MGVLNIDSAGAPPPEKVSLLDRFGNWVEKRIANIMERSKKTKEPSAEVVNPPDDTKIISHASAARPADASPAVRVKTYESDVGPVQTGADSNLEFTPSIPEREYKGGRAPIVIDGARFNDMRVETTDFGGNIAVGGIGTSLLSGGGAPTDRYVELKNQGQVHRVSVTDQGEFDLTGTIAPGATHSRLPGLPIELEQNIEDLHLENSAFSARIANAYAQPDLASRHAELNTIYSSNEYAPYRRKLKELHQQHGIRTSHDSDGMLCLVTEVHGKTIHGAPFHELNPLDNDIIVSNHREHSANGNNLQGNGAGNPNNSPPPPPAPNGVGAGNPNTPPQPPAQNTGVGHPPASPPTPLAIPVQPPVANNSLSFWARNFGSPGVTWNQASKKGRVIKGGLIGAGIVLLGDAAARNPVETDAKGNPVLDENGQPKHTRTVFGRVAEAVVGATMVIGGLSTSKFAVAPTPGQTII